MILCSAVVAPIVISVPQKSLSIEPTIPAIVSVLHLSLVSFEILFSEYRHSTISGHSSDKIWAPFNDPSPPMHISLFIPKSNKFFAAFIRPSFV